MKIPHFDLAAEISNSTHTPAIVATPATVLRRRGQIVAGVASVAGATLETHKAASEAVATIATVAGAFSESENASCDLDVADRDYEIVERAAIAEYGGGLPRQWADRLAELSYAPRPAELTESVWRERLEAVWIFADRYASALHKASWSFSDLFAIGGPWPRLDQRGAAWFIANARDLHIEADCQRWRTPTGAMQTFTRARLGPDKIPDGRSYDDRPDLNKT